MTSILVTGGAGYIGSHTCKALRLAGFNPVTYDNLARGNPEAVKWGALEIGELADIGRLRETLAQYQPAAVVHFAALAYVDEFESRSDVVLPKQCRWHRHTVGRDAPMRREQNRVFLKLHSLWHACGRPDF